MERILVLITAAAAVCGISSAAQHRFHFVYELKNWTEALNHCREHYTDLVSVDNKEDMMVLNHMADLNQMVYSENSYRAWIGLYDDVNSWRWSINDDIAGYRNWLPGEPSNSENRPLCGQMFDNGRWNDEDCYGQFPSVCSDGRGLNGTFIFINAPMRWTEAQRYCRARHTDLASVRDPAENQKVKNLVPAGQRVWIGLYRLSWRWTDGRKSSFTFWSTVTSEPNNAMKEETCAAANFDVSGKWEDWRCDCRRAFICSHTEPVSKLVVGVKLQKTSSLDLNQPEVMEDLLLQLKQKLKDDGVDGDVGLSWRKQSDGNVFHRDNNPAKKTSGSDEL